MTGHGRKKTDEALALALATGLTVEAACRHANVSESTGYRRLREDSFRKRVEAIRSELLERTVGALTALGPGAVGTLGELVRAAQSETVKMGACRAALEHLFRGRELLTVEQRLSEIEKRIEEADAKRTQPPGAGRGQAHTGRR
jgi:uncharacterized protein (DUF849 family)